MPLCSSRRVGAPRWAAPWLVVVGVILLAMPSPALAQAPSSPGASVDDVLAAVVRIKTFINPDGRTLQTLGREREGSGIVIDSSGLVLTIGYLMVEAHAADVTTSDGRTVAADVVGYDHDTGFGLLRATAPLKVKPMALGASSGVAVGARVIVAGGGGGDAVGAVEVVAKRVFAGYWEYLLEEAIFTAPPVPWWSGAALVSSEGRLVGVGSLVVSDASGKGDGTAGNMFVPIDLLAPILGELIGSGRVSGAPRPWLGMTTHDVGGHLVVARAVPGGPADKAGLKPADIVVGVDGAATATLPDLYRKIWSLGRAGKVVQLDVLRNGEKLRIDVTSASRREHLRLKSTF